MTKAPYVDSSLPPLKKILILGSGGRENSLAWAFKTCAEVKEVWVAPGNGGTASHIGCKRLDIKETNCKSIIESCFQIEIDLVVIGPESPLAIGVADELRAAGLTVFGPGADGAQIEASKAWAKQLMVENQIPTAKYWEAKSKEEAIQVLEKVQAPLVVKLDGLAAGKGVIVPESINATKAAIQEIFEGKHGLTGTKIVLEEKLEGPEVSIFALSDGEQFLLLPTAQDHKRLKEGDKGPNTGGMGAYSPAPLVSEATLNQIKRIILEPTLEALNKKGITYRGVIYAGLMLTNSGPKVIEFNCRFGDPECQTIMPLMGPELAHVIQACALGKLEKAPNLSIMKKCSACVVAASAGYPESPQLGDEVSIDFTPTPSTQIFHAGTKCTNEGKLFTAGGRVLAVVAQGVSFDDAFNKTYQGLKKINFKGITYRRDIGYQVRTRKGEQ